MASSTVHDDGIPKELKEKLATFDTHLSELEAGLEPLLSVNRAELIDKMEPIDAAKTDLVAAYTVNSLFWMYLNVSGVNPKDHAVRQELTRIQSYMARVKEIEDKKKAPKLDKGVSKRFVRAALWHAAQKKKEDSEAEPSASVPDTTQSSASSSHKGGQGVRKRRRDER